MYRIILQKAAANFPAPTSTLLRLWAKAALSTKYATAEITIRLVNSDEMSMLNSTYRKKTGPTNVLSFPMHLPKEIAADIPFIGDIVICPEVLATEAKQYHKDLNAHWAHIVIHGVYHLLGYDHQQEKDALIMEALEIKTLKQLGFPNPYEMKEDNKHAS